MHHTRSSRFEGNVGVVNPKRAQMTGLRRDDRGRAELGQWVKNQRMYKKKLDAGQPNPGITKKRVSKLDELGFEWGSSGGSVYVAFHEPNWDAHLAQLAAFKDMPEHGNCNVPTQWMADPKLGRWVKEQRACKKKLDAGRPNPGITKKRVAKLDKLGFEWAIVRADAYWLAKLAAFKAMPKHGHCRVPQGYAAGPELGRWVKNQRACKKRLDAGEPNPKITAERVAKLEAMGFEWVPGNAGVRKSTGQPKRKSESVEVTPLCLTCHGTVH